VRGLARRLFPYVIVATAGFLAAYLVVFFFVFPTDVIPDERKVPNVVGLPFDKAVQSLDSAGFRARQGQRRYNSTQPPEVVLAQTPPAGSIEQKAADVVLDVSAGQRTGEVPRVIGQTAQQAQVAIENAGLDVAEIREQVSERPRGEVLAVLPAEGENVQIPSGIIVTVSSGPSTVRVPDVMGRQLGEARSVLEQLGLVAGTVTADSTSVEAPNTVIAQSPAAGSPVRAGRKVDLTVSPRAP
jgi:eukaryotic-like serine/threonine-protein kinase